MDIEEMLARLGRAKAIIESISVAGKRNWQALLLVTGDIEFVAAALNAGPAGQVPGVPGSPPGAGLDPSVQDPPAELPPEDLEKQNKEKEEET